MCNPNPYPRWSTEEQEVAKRAVLNYRHDNVRKRLRLQEAADALAAAGEELLRVWFVECIDYPGDAFDGWERIPMLPTELVEALKGLKVTPGYEFADE